MSTTGRAYTIVNPGPIRVVNSWDDFRRYWTSRQNFIIGKNVFPYEYQSPPLVDVVDAVRKSPAARILKRGPNPGLGEKCPEFVQVPVSEIPRSEVQVAHFNMLEFCAKGGVCHGLEQSINGWHTRLAAEGFSWASSPCALFHSGPNCATRYHYDSTYVVAWQIAGVKRFCWLKDPERWCPARVRRNADRYDMMQRPEGLTADDVIEFEMHPGDVLWNSMLTPHWVYALDEVTYSFNIIFYGLACDGQLSPIDLEFRALTRERLIAGANAAAAA